MGVIGKYIGTLCLDQNSRFIDIVKISVWYSKQNWREQKNEIEEKKRKQITNSNVVILFKLSNLQFNKNYKFNFQLTKFSYLESNTIGGMI